MPTCIDLCDLKQSKSYAPLRQVEVIACQDFFYNKGIFDSVPELQDLTVNEKTDTNLYSNFSWGNIKYGRSTNNVRKICMMNPQFL